MTITCATLTPFVIKGSEMLDKSHRAYFFNRRREKGEKCLYESCIYFLLPVSWEGTWIAFARVASAASSAWSSSCGRGWRWPRRGWRARSPSRRWGCRRSSPPSQGSLLRGEEEVTATQWRQSMWGRHHDQFDTFCNRMDKKRFCSLFYTNTVKQAVLWKNIYKSKQSTVYLHSR